GAGGAVIAPVDLGPGEVHGLLAAESAVAAGAGERAAHVLKHLDRGALVFGGREVVPLAGVEEAQAQGGVGGVDVALAAVHGEDGLELLLRQVVPGVGAEEFADGVAGGERLEAQREAGAIKGVGDERLVEPFFVQAAKGVEYLRAAELRRMV